jgi:hypothetical protein
MVEPGDILPIGGDVAALAGAAQLALVHVLVAGGAIPAQTQVGTLQVLDQNVSAGGGRNVVGIVALTAFEMRVAPVQRVAGFPVIEFVERHIPVDRNKVLAVVVGVALDALHVRRPRVHERRVKTAIGGEQAADFGVAGKAPELPFPAVAHVATVAVRGTLQGAMGLEE